MEYPRCKTCKWWSIHTTGLDQMRICNHPKIDEKTDYDREHSLDAMSCSGQEYHTCTGPDFGCVLHEPKHPLSMPADLVGDGDGNYGKG